MAEANTRYTLSLPPQIYEELRQQAKVHGYLDQRGSSPDPQVRVDRHEGLGDGGFGDHSPGENLGIWGELVKPYFEAIEEMKHYETTAP